MQTEIYVSRVSRDKQELYSAKALSFDDEDLENYDFISIDSQKENGDAQTLCIRICDVETLIAILQAARSAPCKK